ncbi:MAG: hypothetical protein MRK01_03600 [Candidatus Scalindua sp.]|nr:hypothetical protein [Candidatus Scalindua sp.]
MTDPFEGKEKRHYRRLGLSLPIMLLNKKIESTNISSTGVYFEVTMENREQFQLGKRIDFEILAKTSSPMLPSRTIRLGGSGEVIRSVIVEDSQKKKKYGVALKFNKKLEILFNLGEIP